jgi:hypothetical protein
VAQDPLHSEGIRNAGWNAWGYKAKGPLGISLPESPHVGAVPGSGALASLPPGAIGSAVGGYVFLPPPLGQAAPSQSNGPEMSDQGYQKFLPGEWPGKPTFIARIDSPIEKDGLSCITEVDPEGAEAAPTRARRYQFFLALVGITAPAYPIVEWSTGNLLSSNLICEYLRKDLSGGYGIGGEATPVVGWKRIKEQWVLMRALDVEIDKLTANALDEAFDQLAVGIEMPTSVSDTFTRILDKAGRLQATALDKAWGAVHGARYGAMQGGGSGAAAAFGAANGPYRAALGGLIGAGTGFLSGGLAGGGLGAYHGKTATLKAVGSRENLDRSWVGKVARGGTALAAGYVGGSSLGSLGAGAVGGGADVLSRLVPAMPETIPEAPGGMVRPIAERPVAKGRETLAHMHARVAGATPGSREASTHLRATYAAEDYAAKDFLRSQRAFVFIYDTYKRDPNASEVAFRKAILRNRAVHRRLTIFDILNTKGLPRTPLEIVKANYILSQKLHRWAPRLEVVGQLAKQPKSFVAAPFQTATPGSAAANELGSVTGAAPYMRLRLPFHIENETAEAEVPFVPTPEYVRAVPQATSPPPAAPLPPNKLGETWSAPLEALQTTPPTPSTSPPSPASITEEDMSDGEIPGGELSPSTTGTSPRATRLRKLELQLEGYEKRGFSPGPSTPIEALERFSRRPSRREAEAYGGVKPKKAKTTATQPKTSQKKGAKKAKKETAKKETKGAKAATKSKPKPAKAKRKSQKK